MVSMQWIFFVVSACAALHAGEALRCWTCSSDMDAPCADFFNTTRFSRYQSFGNNNNQVQLLNCDQARGTNYYPQQQEQRAVCMKKKQTTYGQTTYIRQCRFIPYNTKVGECPEETVSRSTTIDFCEYCDSDECNGALNLRTSFYLAALLPAIGMLLVRN